MNGMKRSKGATGEYENGPNLKENQESPLGGRDLQDEQRTGSEHSGLREELVRWPWGRTELGAPEELNVGERGWCPSRARRTVRMARLRGSTKPARRGFED